MVSTNSSDADGRQVLVNVGNRYVLFGSEARLGEEGASSRLRRFRLLGDMYSIKKPRTTPGLKFAGDQGD
jgi:hypothetical protein